VSSKTSIAWTDATWNPTVGDGHALGGLTALDLPLRWKKPCRIFVDSMSDLFHEALSDEQIDQVFAVMALAPQHTFQVLTKRPERMREYLNADDTIRRIAVLADSKRSSVRGNIPEIGPLGHGSPGARWWPLVNVWLGVSVENQETADERVSVLLDTPAATRFVSYEPALDGVNFSRWLKRTTTLHVRADVEGMLRNRSFHCLTGDDGKELSPRQAEDQLYALHARGVKYISAGACDAFDPQSGCPGHKNPALDWIIVGGESGPGARPFDVAWARSTVEQCKAAEVACFVKPRRG